MNRLHRWYCQTSHWNRTVTNILLWALSSISLGDRVLELGEPGALSTDWLLRHWGQLLCLEIDFELAGKLQQRFTEPNVDVFCGSAAQVPFADCSFNSAVCFTMLHHVPSRSMQDRLFAEVYKVLKPGGTFVGTTAERCCR